MAFRIHKSYTIKQLALRSQFCFKDLGRQTVMKSLMKTFVRFVKREWFLLVMICTISLLVLLFELF